MWTKTMWDGTAAPWNLSTLDHARAIATYLFVHKVNVGPCQRCCKILSMGPSQLCVAGTRNSLHGACTNCGYFRRGVSCSIRRGKGANDPAEFILC
ncbi:hypothetical protein F4777DRAFT_549116 [Nemania sp. FL0916]|nr:hypothetical protein F4777DRAFT_549116 [Nemania sp. FL0916]